LHTVQPLHKNRWRISPPVFVLINNLLKSYWQSWDLII
jgi:hypothetical protein